MGGVSVPPPQDFVVDWRRRSYRWWALVLVVEKAQARAFIDPHGVGYLPSVCTLIKSNPTTAPGGISP
jgi:hypothetical protein